MHDANDHDLMDDVRVAIATLTAPWTLDQLAVRRRHGPRPRATVRRAADRGWHRLPARSRPQGRRRRPDALRPPPVREPPCLTRRRLRGRTRRSAPGARTDGTKRVSLATAIQPLVPAPRSRVCRISPVPRSSASSVPSASVVNTRSLTTVAAPSGSPGTFGGPPHLAGVGVERDHRAVARRRARRRSTPSRRARARRRVTAATYTMPSALTPAG